MILYVVDHDDVSGFGGMVVLNQVIDSESNIKKGLRTLIITKARLFTIQTNYSLPHLFGISDIKTFKVEHRMTCVAS